MGMHNRDLKEDIRDYWTRRLATIDLAFGHRIPPGQEFDAWAAVVRRAIGPRRKGSWTLPAVLAKCPTSCFPRSVDLVVDTWV
jgi:hypothetical protein